MNNRMTLREVIYTTINQFLEENDGMLFGECVGYSGSVANTIPNHSSVIDVPMSETAAADFAIGAALAGRRSIFVVRSQNYLMLGASPFISFASVVKDLYDRSAPVFIRAIGFDRLDCNHSEVVYSLFMHFPGIKVCAPMSPKEWKEAWEIFLKEDQPFFCSEYQDSFDTINEYQDEVSENAVINIFGISKARQNMVETKEILKERGIDVNIFNIAWLKPFNKSKYAEIMERIPVGLVVDAGRVICGASEHIAYELMHQTPGSIVYAYGINDITKSLNPRYYNAVPNSQKIADKVIEILDRNGGL